MSTITKTETETWCEPTPKCIYNDKCGNVADYKTLDGKINGTKSETWGYLAYGNKHKFYWNLCGKCHKTECGEDTDSDDDDDDDKERICCDCNRHFIEDEDNYKEGWVSTKCFEGEGCRTDWDYVCCVGCDEEVCNFGEEPPHKDKRGEAVCEDCYKIDNL